MGSIEQIMMKVLEEESMLENECSALSALAWMFVGLSLSAHIKTKVYQNVLQTILQLLNSILQS